MHIRVELVSGTEGSLSLNSLIKSLQPKDLFSRRNLIALASVALVWFRQETFVWGYQEFLNFLVAHGASTHLSQEDMDAIAKKAAEAMEKRLAEKHVEEVYQALEADPAIDGVGASPLPGGRPPHIVPRSEFHARSGGARSERVEIIQRVRTYDETVTLTRAVLVPTANPRWGFRGREGSFSAIVKDDEFIASIMDGKAAIPLAAGIRLNVSLEAVEELQNGAWVVTGRRP